jgi:hypothetical protein
MPAPALAIDCRAFRVPRRGHTPAECEDADAADPLRGRFAVADGASESDQAARWARLLVECFVYNVDGHADLGAWLPALQERWARQANGARGPALPWYLEARQRQGAFSTFLGLVIEGQTWHAQAVGDTCLFQVRGGRLLEAFPVTRAEDFGSTPWLVGSRAAPEGARADDADPGREAVYRQGDCRAGDRLYLMTDALAHWFLSQVQTGEGPWIALDALLQLSEVDFFLWVDAQRKDGRLRDDDVTLVAVSL